MPETNETPDAPQKKESFITRMQRRGVLTVQPPKPGELNVIDKLKEMRQAEGRNEE